MNSISCESLESRLLDGMALEPADQLHLEHCESCAQLHQAFKSTSPAMADLGAVARESVPANPRQLDRVRQAALARLQAQSSAAADSSLEDRSIASLWAAFTQWLFRPRVAGGGLALAGLLVAAFLGFQWHLSVPVGQVDFAHGLVEVSQRGHMLSWRGLPDEAELLRGGTVVAREQNAILSLADGSVRLAMAQGTELTVTSPRSVRLTSGEIWLDVDPHGKGFQVITDIGTATVAGTVFGVSTGAARMRVDVARGEVIVAQSSEARSVTKGQWVDAAREGGVGLVTAREDGEGLPGWVTQLKKDEDKATTSMYVPSVQSVR